MADQSNYLLQKRITELEKKVAQSTNQLEQLSSKLLKAESLRSSFLSHILNEVNNPLTSILGLINGIVSMAHSNPELVHKQANMAFEEAFELDYNMRNIFAAAGIEAGTLSVQPGKVDVSYLLDSILQGIDFKTKRKNLKIERKENNERDDFFHTDPSMLRAMLLNLVGNAIEFSAPRRFIKIDLDIGNEGIVFSITDCGPGITEEHQKLIFSRFKQLDEGVTKTHPGTGLGLSIVKEYTDLLGGSLDVKSQLGKGTTFTLVLPDISKDNEALAEVSFSEEELF